MASWKSCPTASASCARPDTVLPAPAPDDIYVSPSQIRRFNLHTGDTVEGEIRTPKDGERYFALIKLDSVNGLPPEANKNKIMFENLTPLHPNAAVSSSNATSSREENITSRVIDMIAPIGKGQRGLLGRPAEERQDGDAAAHRPRDHRQPPGRRADRAADRRAPGRSHRNAALRSRAKSSPPPSTNRPPATCRSPKWSSRRPSAWSSTRRTW